MLFLCMGSLLFSQNVNRSILIVTSNQHTYGSTTLNAANHFAEIVLAYDEFVKAGYQVDFVSPNGVAIPIGYLSTSDPVQKQYLYDSKFMDLLKNTHGPEHINPKKYQAIYYSGGGAAMFGVPENKKIQDIAMQIYENNGIISAVCHGTAGLVNLKTKEGSYVYAEKKVNGYPDKFERKEAEYYKAFPFSIENAITNNGGNFVYSEKGWDKYFVIDGRLITGQDPTATRIVAQKVLEAIQNLKH